jgi:hypothetical protein
VYFYLQTIDYTTWSGHYKYNNTLYACSLGLITADQYVKVSFVDRNTHIDLLGILFVDRNTHIDLLGILFVDRNTHIDLLGILFKLNLDYKHTEYCYIYNGHSMLCS